VLAGKSTWHTTSDTTNHNTAVRSSSSRSNSNLRCIYWVYVRAFACVWTLLFCFSYLSSCYFVSYSCPGERTKKKCSLPTSRKITQFYFDPDATPLHLTTKPPNNQPVLVPLGLEPIYRNQQSKSSTSTVKCSQDSTLTSDTGSTPTKPNTIINTH
jgi:hypothetical protein